MAMLYIQRVTSFITYVLTNNIKPPAFDKKCCCLAEDFEGLVATMTDQGCETMNFMAFTLNLP
jgi:hypothetical protein